MLPEFLFSRYSAYKADTSKIASWLAENAAKCGWTAPNNNAPAGDTSQDDKAPRLKGRARKLARDAAAAEKKGPASTKKTDEELPKHVIRIKDFVPMAACIAKHGSPIRISSAFLNLIKRCIMARSSTTDWYAVNANPDDLDSKESLDKHSHFTSILEKVFRTLMARLATDPANEKGSHVSKPQSTSLQTANDAKITPLANLFELLPVEDADENTEKADTSTVDVPETKGSEPWLERPKAKYEIEHDDADVEEEWFFALQLFFHDLQDLKDVLFELWERYRDGKIDLSVAAVANNTAIDLVRRAESDFLREMPVPKMYADWSNGADLCYLNYIDISIKKGFGPEDTEGPETVFDFRRWEDVEHCLLVPYLCLKQFNREVKERNGRIPMMSVEEERRLVTGPRSELTPQERRDEDTTILMSSVSVIASFVSVSNAPSEDEFCAGLRELVKKQKFPLWLVFAAQSYLDVHHILRTDVGRGLRDLQVAGNAAKATLEEHFRFMKTNKCELRDRKDESECRQMMHSIEEWGCNTQESKDLNKYSTRKSGIRWDENCVVKKHPLLAGLLKFSIHLMMQSEGILLVNSVTTVLSTAHLYNAVREEGYLPRDKNWEDLDFILNIHSSQDIFIGNRPTNPEEYAKRMSLAQGISPETFAKNRRSMGPKYSKKGYRELNTTCPVASAFRNRYCSQGSVDLSIQIVEDLIHQLAFKEQKFKTGINKRFLKHWKSCGLRLRLEDFVEYLAEALQLEATQYQFDYFGLYRRVWALLKSIKEKIRPIVVKTFNEMIMKKYDSDSGVVMLPSIVTVMACDITKSPNLLHVKRSVSVDVEPLKITGSEMERFIEEGEGDAEMRRLRQVCPGFAEMEWMDEEDQPDASDGKDIMEHSQVSEDFGQNLDKNNALPDVNDISAT
ncbi:hypothetical protein GJ744_004626 [Endocarpon pusillum]|uniref:DUF6604 domain-containing protein n=1 Tax=Endocarpon pusillum TaxID=364733 RepID=A0A8H7E6T5_9EURO|nr:hypothetical protein GJ744_004626 [Endocarpon pusillum]